ncbi:polyprenyl synthetase family protein [Pontibacter sp. G13]|uniref:polyprenyl synthetase family protein n=1 Tax=Pontibacter sp. G13 TaxID=3074898 RepID=UPI0028890FB6|nr:polyprenyl synthetase family protein [Pontibacter sp. G13]WNJ20699.1 polyprenyl synthetase family protein [Pontibacter sp. G13]
MKTAVDYKQRIESHIDSLGLASRKPLNLYQPMDYLLKLKGKRIRPTLVMLSYEAVSGRPAEEVLNIAACVELFHNFTLMHDDIMDRAPVRRGMPSVHIKWDENVAILSGDAMFTIATELVIEDKPALAAPLLKAYSEVALGVCEGQMEDMDFATQTTVEIEDYIEMIRKKTAVLLGGCLQLGAIAGGADEETVLALKQFGETLGIAFQLQDDFMDAFPPEGFGKQVGGDILEMKKTYLYLKALELADADTEARLRDLYESPHEDADAKVQAVLEIFRQLEIPAHTESLIEESFQQAIQLGEQLQAQMNMEGLKSYLQVIAKRTI